MAAQDLQIVAQMNADALELADHLDKFVGELVYIGQATLENEDGTAIGTLWMDSVGRWQINWSA